MLIELDFNEREKRIYLFLALNGPQKVATISKKLKLHRVQAYRFLEEMHKKNFVELTFESPKRYAAAELPKVWYTKTRSLKRNLDLLENTREEMLENWAALPGNKTTEEGAEKFSIIQGPQKVFQEFRAVTLRAKEETCSFIPIKALIQLSYEKNEEPKHAFKVLTENVDEADPINRFLSEKKYPKNVIIHFVIKKFEPFPWLIIRDNEEIVLFVNDPNCPNLFLDSSALKTDNKVIISIVKRLFDEEWRKSKVLLAKIKGSH
jgi:sugar-specific transcriptional regulator TrmB